MSAEPRERWRLTVITALALASLFGFFAVGPIAQDQAYHAFADQRGWLGIPSFANVASNLPFALIGLWGLKRSAAWTTPARLSWRVFFVGVTLVALGSAYYHWRPDDPRLVWDRLPMTVGFIGLTVALVVEWVGAPERWLLALGLALGVGSVLVWVETGDLRLYYGVQLMPMVVAIAALSLYRAPFSGASRLLVAVGLYAAAKGTEALDSAIHEATGGAISGHPLKHLLAAGAIWAILQMLERRVARGVVGT